MTLLTRHFQSLISKWVERCLSRATQQVNNMSEKGKTRTTSNWREAALGAQLTTVFQISVQEMLIHVVLTSFFRFFSCWIHEYVFFLNSKLLFLMFWSERCARWVQISAMSGTWRPRLTQRFRSSWNVERYGTKIKICFIHFIHFASEVLRWFIWGVFEVDGWQCWCELVKASKPSDFGMVWLLWCSCGSFEGCYGRRFFFQALCIPKVLPIERNLNWSPPFMIQHGLQCRFFWKITLVGRRCWRRRAFLWLERVRGFQFHGFQLLFCLHLTFLFRFRFGLRCPTDFGHFGCWWIEPFAQPQIFFQMSNESSAEVFLQQRRSPQSQRARTAFHRRRGGETQRVFQLPVACRAICLQIPRPLSRSYIVS